MRLKAEDLPRHLNQALQPIYWVSGDEPLLTIEACDAIRQTARQQNFDERILFHPEGMNWDKFRSESQSMSLFAQRRIIELHLPSGRPGTEGAKVLAEYAAAPPPDTLLLFVTGKLDKGQLSSKWAKAFENTGVHIRVWPVKPREIPQWLHQRLQHVGIQADRSAIDILADRVEGNLLAAKQEVEKLQLLVEPGEPVTADVMSTLVADSARYDVFTLIERILAGEAIDTWRTLRGLQEEGAELIPLLTLVSREVRSLLGVAEALDAGQSFETACNHQKIWKTRMPQVRNALRHIKPSTLRLSLRHARLIDQMLKGATQGDAWVEFSSLCLALARQNPRSRAVVQTALSG